MAIKGKDIKVVRKLFFVWEDDEYLQLFKDNGWDYLGNMFNWRYFIKEYDENDVNEIFTEKMDVIDGNKRILMVLFPITFLNFIYGCLNLINIIKYNNFFSFAFIPFSNLAASALLLIAVFKIIKRNVQLKKQIL